MSGRRRGTLLGVMIAGSGRVGEWQGKAVFMWGSLCKVRLIQRELGEKVNQGITNWYIIRLDARDAQTDNLRENSPG